MSNLTKRCEICQLEVCGCMTAEEREWEDEMADLLAEIETLQGALEFCNDKACALLAENERLRKALDLQDGCDE